MTESETEKRVSISLSTGAFINFPLNYQVTPNEGGLTNHQQAVKILTKGRQLLAAGFPCVAIIYSNEGKHAPSLRPMPPASTRAM